VVSLGAAVVALAVLLGLNLIGVTRKALYIIVGIILWVCVLKSGVHATLAGVALAMMIPLAGKNPDARSPLRDMEHELHPWVAFGVLPIFAFANAGVSFEGVGLSSLFEPVTLGIALGLFLGKPIGIYGTIWLADRFGILRLPTGVSRMQLFGVSILCGIGFTMSLFIGGLAWEHANFDAPVRLGVIAGSIASALLGSLVLLVAPHRREESAPLAEAVPPTPSVSERAPG
jgi:NhaA family Na+:H+ antiporter